MKMTMLNNHKGPCLLLCLLVAGAVLFAQDNVSITVKNISRYPIKEYRFGIQGQLLAGSNIAPGDSQTQVIAFNSATVSMAKNEINYRISINNTYFCSILFDTIELPDVFNINEMDYTYQVTDQLIEAGKKYCYLVDTNEERKNMVDLYIRFEKR